MGEWEGAAQDGGLHAPSKQLEQGPLMIMGEIAIALE